MKVYSTKASSSVHLRVDYQCSYCDQMNSDSSQYLVANAESHGSLYPSSSQAIEAKQRVAEKIQTQISDIGKGDLQSAHLTCVCSSCGKRQAWASFMKYPVWAIVLFVLWIILVIALISRWGQFAFRPQQLIIPLMPIPLIVIAVNNLLVKSKVSRLDPKYLPKISYISDQGQNKQS